MPAIGTSQPVSIQYLDYSGERKSVKINVGELTAVSLPGFLTNLAAWETALDNVTLGTRAKSSWGAETVVSNTKPVDKDAQIETEMLVSYMDDTTEAPYTFRITTVDYTAFNYGTGSAGDEVIISGAGASAATTAFITAFEDIARSPDNDANTVTITGMRVVR